MPGLCLLGYVVFSVEYRLVPTGVYDQFSDVSTAMTFYPWQFIPWGNPDKFYGLLTWRCLSFSVTNEAAMTKNKKFAKVASLIKAPIFPLNALWTYQWYVLHNPLWQIGLFTFLFVWKGLQKKAIALYVNMKIRKLFRHLPPCFLVTSLHDNLEHYTDVKFEKRLKAKPGITMSLRFGKIKLHASPLVYLSHSIKESTKTLKSMHEYFQSFLEGPTL